ncbi:3-oxoadipate enol-lactonase 1 [Fusarium oxysporum f. sp. albedinis]|nr:3-oxoadipate enol-lactonase 1 [Fusarium oxysporum f. sp. albedinis]
MEKKATRTKLATKWGTSRISADWLLESLRFGTIMGFKPPRLAWTARARRGTETSRLLGGLDTATPNHPLRHGVGYIIYIRTTAIL